MKARKLLVVMVLVFGCCLLATPGKAALVTSLADGTVFPMPDIAYSGQGPQTFGPGITWSSTSEFSGFGYAGDTFFGVNGKWDGSLGTMAFLNTTPGTMAFEFSNLVNGVGGFLNYAPIGTTCTIAVYDSTAALIESYDLTFNFRDPDLVNGGSFYGFLEASNNIKYFTLSNSYISITNLTVSANPVPIPGAVWLLGSGLLGLGGWRRFRKS